MRVIAATNRVSEQTDQGGQVPRGSVLSAECHPDRVAPVARPQGGHHAARDAFRGEVRPTGPATSRDHARSNGSLAPLSVARQRTPTGKRDGACLCHGTRRHRSTGEPPRSCQSPLRQVLQVDLTDPSRSNVRTHSRVRGALISARLCARHAATSVAPLLLLACYAVASRQAHPLQD